MIPQDDRTPEAQKGSKLKTHPHDPYYADLPPEQQDRAMKALARVQKYVEAGELDLDDDMEAVIKLIVKDGVNINPSKVLTKDWAIRAALRRMYDEDIRSSTRQRCFEFVCELMGFIDTGKKAGISAIDVTVEALNGTQETTE